jgi:hypothetical protein
MTRMAINGALGPPKSFLKALPFFLVFLVA